MALPAGQIDMNQVNVEDGFVGTTTISMNDNHVRSTFQVGSGQISMSNGQSKSRLSASLNAYTEYASATSPGTAYTGTVTASPSGGVGAYTYAWSYVSGDTFNISNASNAAVQWDAALLPGSYVAEWICTITDSLGITAATASCVITMDFY